jgi:hypothetical protein
MLSGFCDVPMQRIGFCDVPISRMIRVDGTTPLPPANAH